MPEHSQAAGTTWLRWPDDQTGPWLVGLHFDIIDGRSEVVGAELWSRAPREAERLRGPLAGLPGRPRPIRATDLRLPLDSIIRAERKSMAAAAAAVVELDVAALTAAQRRYARKVAAAHGSDSPKGRPRLYDGAHFLDVAEVYSAAHLAGDNPRQAVARYFRVSASTAAKWVARARQEGFLAPTGQGRAGGVPVRPVAPKRAKARPRSDPARQAEAEHQAVERRLWDQKTREKG